MTRGHAAVTPGCGRNDAANNALQLTTVGRPAPPLQPLCSLEFACYQQEWWHFEYGTRRWAAVRGERPLWTDEAAPGHRNP